MAGVDLGSRTIKVAIVKEHDNVYYLVAESQFDPHRQAEKMLQSYAPAKVVATGYGRHLAQRHFADDVITEIKAHAIGARYHHPECRTILDVGGQDSKVINLDGAGRVANFQMNDKCAAGTGRFLEMMGAVLGYPLQAFGNAALSSDGGTKIGSMCAVFAESEVVSLKNRGIPPPVIARAVHESVVDRLAAMLNKAGYQGDILFSGGVANNSCIVSLLQQRLGCRVIVPERPETVGALGAALHGATTG